MRSLAFASPSNLLDGLEKNNLETAQQIAGANVFNGFEAPLLAASTTLSSALDLGIKMIRALIITVVLIIPSITVAGDIYTEYIWGADISKIKKQYEISRFDNEILSSNLKRFFSPSFRTNFSQYLTVKQFDFSHKGYKFTRGFGFHKDKLIYTFLFTDELPLPPDFKHTQLV